MIKVHYDLQTTLIKGYYPDSFNYSSIPEPFIEIEDKQQVLDKTMCVINGVYQEYIPSKEEVLSKAKQEKLAELDNFHDSDEVRNFKIKTPKNLFTFSTLSESRDLLVEQIDFNRNGIESGLIAPEKAGFLFFQVGKSEFISFNNLKFIYAKLMELVNTNFAIKLSHKTKINAIVNLEDLKKYDFKKGYIINQQFEIK